MRIAYLINSVEGGGAAFPIPDIVAVLRNAGHEVAVFALTPRDRRAAPPILAAGIPLAVRDGGTRDHIRAFIWLKRQLDAWRPNLIWTSLTRATLLGQIYAIRRKLPTVHWQHNAYLKPANIILLRMVKHWSTLWIADSRCVETLTRQRLGICDSALACWPIFKASLHHRERQERKPGTPVKIGSLGRLHISKGFDVLIEAASILAKLDDLPDVLIEVAGDGPERARLLQKIDRLRAPVRLIGHVEDTERFLDALHIYVQPSLCEGFCIAVHEAMLSGLPVIATAVGEMAHAVQPEMGITLRQLDAPKLAEALAQLIRQPERCRIYGRTAQHAMQTQYGGDRFAAHGASILRRLEHLVGSAL